MVGATGDVGSHVARAYRHAGHEVWDLTRRQEMARSLETDAIHAVIGDTAPPDSYRAMAGACDVLVHAAQDYQDGTAALDRLAVETLLDAARSACQPKTLVYKGGSWGYGRTDGRVFDETSPPRPLAAVGWHPSVERLVLGARDVRTVVLRHGNVYGYGGKLTNPCSKA